MILKEPFKTKVVSFNSFEIILDEIEPIILNGNDVNIKNGILNKKKGIPNIEKVVPKNFP
jgi:hypothetical protein